MVIAQRLFLATLLLAGCTTPRTEVLVVTDSDLRTPDELDEIRIEVTAPDGSMQTSVALLGPDQSPLPRVLGLVHDQGSLGPFTVNARGFRAGNPLVSRSAEFSFQPERTLVLRMDLVRTCVGVSCSSGQTCAPGGCRSTAVDPAELEEWQGSPTPLDGGVTPFDAGPGEDGGGVDAGPVDAGCSAPEICNGLDDDCDSSIDEGIDTETDPSNCGACGTVCSSVHATSSCVAGACVISSCDAGFDDCDMNAANGCEADLTDPMTCGDCATACGPPTRVCCSTGCERECL